VNIALEKETLTVMVTVMLASGADLVLSRPHHLHGWTINTESAQSITTVELLKVLVWSVSQEPTVSTLGLHQLLNATK
jgi:hypothetical protein